MPKASSFVLVAVALALPSAAQASLFCELEATRSGFVALRAGPSPAAKLIHRMRVGDEVMVYPGREGPWIEVAYWRGGRWRMGKRPGGDPITAVGWMQWGLLKPDSCG